MTCGDLPCDDMDMDMDMDMGMNIAIDDGHVMRMRMLTLTGSAWSMPRVRHSSAQRRSTLTERWEQHETSTQCVEREREN